MTPSLRWILVGIAVAAVLGPARSTAVPAAVDIAGTPVATPTACPVTVPNRSNPPGHRGPGGYGNARLWTNLWMWGEGEVPVPPTHVLPDGSLGDLKWSWYRYVPGRLTIEGHRLDAPAPPLRAHVLDGYGDLGFQVTGLIFPTGGCWEVTGMVGETRLTFVTFVVPPRTARTPLATP